jgi:spore germination protein YaaH
MNFVKSEKKIILTIFTVALALASLAFFMGKISNDGNTLSPFSKPSRLLSLFGIREKPKNVIYGYLPYWSLGSVDYLQPEALTDIAYFGVYINSDGSIKEKTMGEDGYMITEPGYDKWNNDPSLTKIINKAKLNSVRFALTIISHEDAATDKFLDCRDCWTTLLNNVVTELNKKGIKDVNVNFEYAEYTDEDKANKYSEFIKYLNESLDTIFGDSFVVASAFADSAIKPRVSSDLESLGRYADGIFIMAYDFHRPASDNAGPVAPIGGMGSQSDYDLNTMIKDFLSKIAPNKLILGVPYYGYNWVVENSDQNAKRIEGNDGIGFSESQVYDKIMQDIAEQKATVQWDEVAQVPYYSYVSPETGSTRQVYFENERSLKIKYELLKNNGLAGVGIWALGYDGDRKELWDLLYDQFVY